MVKFLLLLFFIVPHFCIIAQSPYLIVLGTVQDGGSPHIGCEKDCCALLMEKPDPERMVVSLGLVDTTENKRYLFEATPHMPRQLNLLNELAPMGDRKTADGIFLTHAHIGHYTGLMYFGKEALNSKEVPVYVMPEMAGYLTTNGPWSQLVEMNNIALKQLENKKNMRLTSSLDVMPIRVPHRDEYSETVGYLINGPSRSALFIPDIDKWSKWNENILEWIKRTDYVLIDGSFYDQKEISHRDISQIPHPFIIESMALFQDLTLEEKSRVYFIHFNHTNPVFDRNSDAYKQVLDSGFNIAEFNDRFEL